MVALLVDSSELTKVASWVEMMGLLVSMWVDQ